MTPDKDGKEAGDKNPGVPILPMTFEENRSGWSSLESASSCTPLFTGWEDQLGNRKELPVQGGLRARKEAAPEAQRRRGCFQKEEVTKRIKK